MKSFWVYLLIGVALTAASFGVVKGVQMYKRRGLRNNNPGNLVLTNINWNGKVPNAQNTDGKFEQFVTPAAGIRAMFIDLRGDIEKDGKNTITKLLSEYAPGHENDLPAYIASVSKQTGLAPGALIKPVNYLALMKAIIKHENGINPYTDQQITAAMNS